MAKDDISEKIKGRSQSTLMDVALHAGVSVSTAGRVLRGSKLPVTPGVAKCVNEAAAILGYVPNIAARSLRGAKSCTIGLVVGDMIDPYYTQIAEAVTHAAESEHNMLAIVCNIQRNPSLELKYCRRLWEHRVDGLILSGGGFDQHLYQKDLADLVDRMQAAGVVVVTLSPRSLNAPVFSVNNFAAGRLAAKSLIDVGHRRVGIVTGTLRSETARERLEGALDVLHDARAATCVRQADFLHNSVFASMESLLEDLHDTTAVLAGSDFMARTIINWLVSRGIRVPEDVSVVGIGNTIISDSMSPRITTVDVHLSACANAALGFIANSGGRRDFVPPDPALVWGDTVSCEQT